MNYNFSNYKKIYIYLLLLVFITGFVFSSALPVFASESVTDFNLLSVYEISDYIMPNDSSDEFEKFGCGTDTANATWYLKMLNKGVWNVTGTIQNVTDYPHFFIASYTRKPVNDQQTTVKFFQLPEDAFILFLNKGYYVMVPNCPSDYRSMELEMINEGTPSLYEFENDRRGDTKYFGDIPYQAFYVAGYSSSVIAPVINSDVPYYHLDVDYLVDVPSSNSAFDESENGNSSSDFGGSNTEDIVNHLTLKDDTKFYISNSSFNTGNLYIYPVFDKTQLDENETLNQYYLRLTGTVSTNTTYNSGSTQYKAKVNGKRVTTYFPMTNGSSNIYNFSLGSSGGSYYDIPLSSVNNGKYEMSFSQLHKLFYGSGSNDNNYELLARGYDSLYGGTSYFESVSNFIGGISVKGFNYNPQTSADIDIVPTKVHYHLDLYVVKKSLDEESISDVQSYIDGDLCDGNGISGENVNTSSDEDIMNALGTDYVPNEYTSPETNTDYKDTYNNVGGSSSSSSGGNSVSPSITGGNNNIVITNNNTNNGSGSGSTSESSLVGSTIVTTLIKYIAGNKSSSVSYIEDIAGTNTYLQIVSNYMSFVPTEIWSLVVTCFSVCIGVVVVAFIISIVIKIIT